MSTVKPTLYYTTTSCGAANFIAAFTGDLKIDYEQVNIGTKKTASGKDFFAVNPKGNVPTILLPDGSILNENAATLQWIADQAPESGLAPKNGTIERYHLQNWLCWIGTELHGCSAPLFGKLDDQTKDWALKRLQSKYALFESKLKDGQKFLLGDHFTVADSYAYIVLSWHPHLGGKLDDFPKVRAFFEGIKALPNVQAAHKKMAELPQAGH